MNIQEELINRAGGNSYVLSLPDSEFESFVSNGRYGAKLKSGNVVIISPTFDNYFMFKNGVAVVLKNNKYGAINKLGELVLPIEYDYLGEFNESLARIKINGKWGYVDVNNRVIIPCQYENAGNFNMGVASVQDKGLWFYIYANNKLAILPRNSYKYVGDFIEGLALVCNNYNQYGFIDMKGEEVIKCIYQKANPFRNERAIVLINGKYGFIDYEGKLVIPAKYCNAHDFDDCGLAMVTKVETLSRDEVTLHINKLGKIIKEISRIKGIGSEIAENGWQIGYLISRIFRGG